MDAVPTDRTELLTIRISPGEMQMLKDLAAVDGITVSDVVRMFARRTHAERFGNAAPKRSKPKPKR